MQISDCYFNDEITLEKPVTKQGASAGAQAKWETVNEVAIRAAIQPMSVRDMNLYAGRQIKVSHNVYIEEDPGFKRGYRLRSSDGRYFTIKGVIEFAGTDRVWKIIADEILE